jgi:hypothetical protein
VSLCSIAAVVIIVLPFTAFGQNIFLFKRPTVYMMSIIASITTAYFVATETIKIVYYHCLFGKSNYSKSKI